MLLLIASIFSINSTAVQRSFMQNIHQFYREHRFFFIKSSTLISISGTSKFNLKTTLYPVWIFFIPPSLLGFELLRSRQGALKNSAYNRKLFYNEFWGVLSFPLSTFAKLCRVYTKGKFCCVCRSLQNRTQLKSASLLRN